jgi:hypothetical protein
MAAMFNWFAAPMKAKMSVIDSRASTSLAPSNDESRRPHFRLFAAITMLGFIVAAGGAIVLSVLALGDVIGLPNDAVMSNIELLAPPVPADPNAIPSVGLLLRTLLSQHTVITLICLTALMLVIAFLLRKVVLAGLRD